MMPEMPMLLTSGVAGLLMAGGSSLANAVGDALRKKAVAGNDAIATAFWFRVVGVLAFVAMWAGYVVLSHGGSGPIAPQIAAALGREEAGERDSQSQGGAVSCAGGICQTWCRHYLRRVALSDDRQDELHLVCADVGELPVWRKDDSAAAAGLWQERNMGTFGRIERHEFRVARAASVLGRAGI